MVNSHGDIECDATLQWSGHCFRLEYKYMKLVADANTKEGELPAAESCGLDEEDEDEQFDSVKFNEGKGRKFFSRLKMGSKRVS